MTQASTILGQFSVEEFVRDYFQKKHLFLPGALSDFESPVAPDELAGLACEESVEARLVLDTREVDGSGRRVSAPWRLREGPFSEEDFAALGEEAWTLLVQDVDKFVPEVGALLRLVDFLPRWSVDDIMISYAVSGGSVGPHTDRYDVFLVQARGTRRWQVSTQVDGELRSDTELKVLREFSAEETFDAKPGDVLYLPPGVAHYGVALDECLTYSFGFRAPTEDSLLSSFADALVADAGSEQLREVLKSAVESPAEISAAVLGVVQDLVAGHLKRLAGDSRFLGRMLTEPKPNLRVAPPEAPFELSHIKRRCGAGGRLMRDPASRFLYFTEGGETTLFVDGSAYRLGSGPEARQAARALSEETEVSVEVLDMFEGRQQGSILRDIWDRGALRFADED